MTNVKIKFHSVEEIEEFVNHANTVTNEMDLCSGSRMVDAKSLLGVLAMGIDKVLELHFHGEMPSEFGKILRCMSIAC
ncbi:hypothetical protein P261_01664 [Lachnospiraceae bacterium TWA4]|nr:hypothetical protein P261_01664 [Lachnospiraceae bacterium TWA4]